MIKQLSDTIQRRARLYQHNQSTITNYNNYGEVEKQYTQVTSKYVLHGTTYEIIEIASKVVLVTVSHGARTYQFDADSDYFTERKWHMQFIIEDMGD